MPELLRKMIDYLRRQEPRLCRAFQTSGPRPPGRFSGGTAFARFLAEYEAKNKAVK
jgi:hypothetical protein